MHDSEAVYDKLVEQEVLIADAQELVLELLERVGMNKSHLAGALGRTRGYVSQLLSGERNMTLRTLADLAGATGYRIELAASPIAEPKNYAVAVRPAAPDLMDTLHAKWWTIALSSMRFEDPAPKTSAWTSTHRTAHARTRRGSSAPLNYTRAC